MRIAGFASGMDIDSIVKDLMNVERIPLQNLKSKKQTLEWTQEAYRGINTLLLDFENTLVNMRLASTYRARNVSSSNEDFVTATASSAANLTSFQITSVKQLAEAAYRVNNEAISLNENDRIDKNRALFLEAEKMANNPTGVWDVGAIKRESFVAQVDNDSLRLSESVKNDYLDKINIQLNGKAFKVVTSGDVSNLAADEVLVDADGNITFAEGVLKKGARVSVEYVTDQYEETRTLSSPTETYQLSAGSIDIESFQMTIDGTTYTIDQTTPVEGTTYQLTGNSGPIGTIDVATGKITFSEELAEETEISVEYKQNFTTFKLGAHTADGETTRNFFISGDKSLNTMISEVNRSNIGLSIMYDEYTDRVTISRTETGNFNEGENAIIMEGDFLEHNLRFSGSEEVEGKNAIFTINGLETSRPSNSFQIDGVSIQLKQTFISVDEAQNEGDETLTKIQPIRLTVSNNTDDVVEKIKDFVETYNTLIATLNNKVNEKYYRDYGPLTDEQREQLTDKQQEDWEEKAKSGLLRRDPILRDALSSMRRDFYSPINNESTSSLFNQLAAIGITTTRDYMAGGKLEINEAKLREAIELDPTAVENLFRAEGNSYEEKGIVARLRDTITGVKDRIYERAGRASWNATQYTIGRNMRSLDQQISRFELRLEKVEERYWRQFTAMEKAMAQANSQAMYLMQQFSGMY